MIQLVAAKEVSGEDRIRTIAGNAEKTRVSDQSGAKCGALDARKAGFCLIWRPWSMPGPSCRKPYERASWRWYVRPSKAGERSRYSQKYFAWRLPGERPKYGTQFLCSRHPWEIRSCERWHPTPKFDALKRFDPRFEWILGTIAPGMTRRQIGEAIPELSELTDLDSSRHDSFAWYTIENPLEVMSPHLMIV
ncbi:MAG: hypothetical protein KDB14_25680 [Planctomycetales bacterium]|nr:hypothetical protein [Planctomycetales bacterium]